MIDAIFDKFRSGVSDYRSAYNVVVGSYKKFRVSFFLLSFFFISISILTATLPYFLKKTAEAYIHSDSYITAFFWAAITYAFLWTLTEVLENVKGIFSAHVLGRSEAALVENALKKLLSAKYAIQRNFDQGTITSNISRGSVAFCDVTVSLFWTLIPIGFEIFTAIFFLYHSLGFAYSAFFLASIVILVNIAIFVAVKSRNIHEKLMDAMNEISDYSVSRLSMPFEVRVNTANTRETQIRQCILENYVETVIATNKKSGFLLIIQAIATGILLALSVFALILYKNRNGIGTGDFIMIAGYIGMLTMQLRLIAGACIDIQRQVVYLKSILQYTELEESGFKCNITENQSSDNNVLFEVKGVQIKNTIKGSSDKVSFSILQGMVTALSAPSGFGKSTILNYLVGIESPENGCVYFKGSPVSIDNSDSLLSMISVVPQKPKLMPGNVKTNLIYGVERPVTDEEMMRLLMVLDLVPDSEHITDYSFLYRETNSHGNLSGGEIQRICIGRALLRKKQIIILDEPTSAIGESLAVKLIDIVRREHATVVLISHNPKILSLSDQLICIDKLENDEARKEFDFP